MGGQHMDSVSSRITSKFQTTIPKVIRERLKLSAKDTLTWQIDQNNITVRTNKNRFLRYQNSIRTGKGDIEKDLEMARQKRTERYR
jgi:bifunctional DNA-binding transcriptional regulator/antitoxin component of YhaV-PrlF toxin-antitoxin module